MSVDIPRKILVVDPGMAQIFGHNYAYNRALQRWFTAKQVHGSFLFSHLLPPDILAEFPDSRAVFAWSPYLLLDPAKSLRRTAEAFAAELYSLVDVDAETLIFAHTLNPTGLYGFALWQAALPESRRPLLALNIMLDMSGDAECWDRLAPSCDLLRQTEKVRLFGGSKGSARLLSNRFGTPCTMLPSPLPENLESYRVESCPDRPIFGLIGDARQGKNLHALAPAMLRYLASGGRGVFRIHLTPTDEAILSSLLPIHDLHREYPEQVAIDWSHLDENDYYACLGRFTALIIPYSPNVYHVCRPSGPVIEAAALGVPIIAYAGGFAEDELALLDNGSLFIEHSSAKDLALAFSRFEREKDVRKAKAVITCSSYAALHGTDAIIRLLFYSFRKRGHEVSGQEDYLAPSGLPPGTLSIRRGSR